jgi:hypothetical protein
MDTLCIPVKKADEDLKIQAINNMASIYAMSESVLVLDYDLLQLKGVTLGTELYARLVCCTWNSRSWTLHEGALADQCVFQLAEQMLCLRQGNQTLELLPDRGRWSRTKSLNHASLGSVQSRLNPRRTVRDDLLSHVKRTLILFPYSRDTWNWYVRIDANKFIALWNALVGRSTSMADDLYHIFANIAGLQTHSLVHIGGMEEKLHCIFLSFDSLPASLLFLPRRDANSYGSGLNAFLPSAIGKDILLHGLKLTVDRTSKLLTFSLERQESAEYDILACVIPAPMSRLQSCTLRLEEQKYTCTLEWLPGLSQHMHPKPSTICVFVEKPREDASYNRGICFFVLQHTKGRTEEHAVDTYTLAFCCRLRLRRMPFATQDFTDLIDPVFEGSTIPPLSRIGIKYGLYCLTDGVFLKVDQLAQKPPK